MVPTERPLDNPINWSFRLARVAAIDVRVHVVFLLAAAVVVWMEIPQAGEGLWSGWQAVADGLGTYAILFALVLLHEFGHCYGARSVGGTAREILLWPLGGLAYLRPPHDPRAHLLTAMSGPTVNVAVCAICSGAIAAWFGTIGAVPWNPLHPTLSADPTVIPTTGQMWLLRLFGISYFLLLINMLPIFPFDGGRMLQAWLWQKKGYRTSIELSTATGMIAAIALGLFALFTEQSWLLLMVAIFGYITCWQVRRTARERHDPDMPDLGYEPRDLLDGAGFGGLGRHENGDDRSGGWSGSDRRGAEDSFGGSQRSEPGYGWSSHAGPRDHAGRQGHAGNGWNAAGGDRSAGRNRRARFGYLAHRRVRRAVLREQRERREHEARRQAVEDVLRKIAQHGLDSLTAHELGLLEAETDRRRAACTDFAEPEVA